MSLTITSDHKHAAAVLQKIAQICAAHGANWNPEVSAEIRGGAMRILAPPGTTGPLISMPTVCWCQLPKLSGGMNPTHCC